MSIYNNYYSQGLFISMIETAIQNYPRGKMRNLWNIYLFPVVNLSTRIDTN